MRKFRILPSLAILMAGIVLSWVVSNVVARATWERDQERFHNEVQFAQERVQWHLETCQQVLLGLRAWMATRQDRQETIVASYTQQVSLRKTFPGVQGIGFARWMAPSELNSRPGTDNPYRLIVTGLEPQDEQGASALGLDLAADASRMDAILRARDSGLASALGPLPWLQGPSPPTQDGFHLVVPIYRGGAVPSRLEERRTQFLGVVFARFLNEELFGSLLHDLASTAAVVELSDATTAETPPFYSAGLPGTSRAPSPRFSEVRHLSVADRTWSLRVTSGADFDTKADTWLPWVLYGAGNALTFFVYAVSRVQQRGRARAEAREATLRELASRNEQLVEQLTMESHRKDEEIRERKKTDQSLRDEMRTKEVLYSLARTLGNASSLDAVIEEVTEKSRAFLDASFGAFLPHDPALRLAHATPVVGLASDKLLDALTGLLPQWTSCPAPPPLRRPGTSEPEMPAGSLGYEVLRDLSQVPATRSFSKVLNDALDPLTTASLLRVPLVSRSGTPWGVLVFGHHAPGMFSEGEGKLLASVASQASLALDNARLLQEARDAQRRAEEANRSKDDFLGVVSHELRTPLNAIQGWAQVLSRKEARTDDKVERGIAVIRRNVDVQLRIIEDILDVARILNGKLHLEMHPTPMAAVVHSAVDSLRFAAESKGILLKLEVQSDALVNGDGTRLQQVVWNLVSNAIKFSRTGDTVVVTLIESDQSLHLAVKDHGRGIAPEDLGVVFERFRQVDSSTTRAEGGLGLGLAIVRSLVEAHGGHVGVESAGQGQGCTFWVDLPRALPLALPAEGAEQTDLMASLSNATLDEVEAPATSQRFPRASLQGLVVLVVDDEPDATEWLVESLRAWGADVREATSAKEALRRIQTDHPHLVISDLAMPEMDGFSLVRELRALNTEDASIPAIALTAFARTEDARKAMLAGFQRHLSKPVNLDSLLRSISEVMAGSPRGSAGSAA